MAFTTTRYSETLCQNARAVPSLDNFTCLRVLGQGGFGIVCLVHPNGVPHTPFALKLVPKAGFIEEELFQERDLLMDLHSAYFCRLFAAFQTPAYVCLVSERLFHDLYVFAVEVRGCPLREQEVRFYMAQLTSAIEFLHFQVILHRDIKPENVLLDAIGYPRITDFGLARNDLTCNSFVGTFQFMAPEMFESDSWYGAAVDYWSLGVTMYFLLTNWMPFAADSEEESIHRRQDGFFYMPDDLSLEGQEFLSALLQPDTNRRIQSMRAVREAAWFAGFEWQALDQRVLPAPFIPAEDVSDSKAQPLADFIAAQNLPFVESDQLFGFDFVNPDFYQ